VSQDTYPPEVRSRVMASVKGRDTTPELLLRRALWALGVRGWRCHRRNLPGKPDLSFGIAKLAVFVDGGFWHGHPSKYWQGRTSPYWDAKIARNQARDRAVNEELRAMDWTVVRLWDFEVEEDPTVAAERIRDQLAPVSRSGGPGAPV
jgi:DNA mismatch endonuclease (patch repair protein)